LTCIVAYRGKDATIIGTDSQWTQGNTKGSMPTGKMWRNGRYVIAAAGNVRSMQVLQHGPQFSADVKDEDMAAHLITKWVPALIASFNDAGALVKKDADTASVEVEAIICSRRRLFRLGGDLSVVEEKDRYVAGGSGEEVALGYLAAKDNLTDRAAYSTRVLVEGALRAAEKHCTGVKGPFYWEIIR
jgi:ATP-dependent protease HslVU (ClpYQ) peptidase subunit